MKKQTIIAIIKHLSGGALLIALVFLVVQAMPNAFGQRNLAKTAAKRSQVPKVNSGYIGVLAAHVPPAPKAPQVVLYNQYNFAGANATVSATFTDFPTFNSDLADDFMVPAGQSWNVQSIDADGVYFNQPPNPQPATSWNVFIYTDSASLPATTPIYSALNQPVTQIGTTFTVNLPGAGAVLTAGTYWIEIQANMTFSSQGEWGWTDRTVTSNSAAAWQNPGGGFGIGCTSWGHRGPDCAIDNGNNDQVFRLNGTSFQDQVNRAVAAGSAWLVGQQGQPQPLCFPPPSTCWCSSGVTTGITALAMLAIIHSVPTGYLGLDPNSRNAVDAGTSCLLAHVITTRGPYFGTIADSIGDFLSNYNTSISIWALSEVPSSPAIAAAIARGRAWLLANQRNCNDPPGRADANPPGNQNNGAWWYQGENPACQPNYEHSNSSFALQGLAVTGGIPTGLGSTADLAQGYFTCLQRRGQNCGNSGFDPDDGGFIYSHALTEGRVTGTAASGSSTFALLLTLVAPVDQRIVDGIAFLDASLTYGGPCTNNNHSYLPNPPDLTMGWSNSGHDTHYAVWANFKAHELAGIAPSLINPFNYYFKLASCLTNEQASDGHFPSADTREDDILATSFALLTLEKVTPVAQLDHFKAYKPNPTPPPLNESVMLKDQFHSTFQNRTVLRPFRFANPVQKSRLPPSPRSMLRGRAQAPSGDILARITNPDSHLELYGLNNTFPVSARLKVANIYNQFGQQQVSLWLNPNYLAVPTQKNGIGQVHNLDHLECYSCLGHSLNYEVDLVDQFHYEPSVRVMFPRIFCNPVIKIHNNVTTPIFHPDAHLVFYAINPQPSFNITVNTSNQFGTQSNLPLQTADLLAVPSSILSVVSPIWGPPPFLNLPTPLVRAVGVYFPPNGIFYTMGGRSSDASGSDLTHPLEYNPATNTWTTRGAMFPDAQVNNMACGLLTVGGSPRIYCVGGSAATQTTATDRVFSYDPLTDAISVAAPWPGNSDGITLPGGFTVFQNKLYILGGFQINTGMTNQIWEFAPETNTWVQKTSVLPVALGYIPATTIDSMIYTAGGSTWTGSTLADSNNSYVYDPVADTISAIASIPRATGETRALNVAGQMCVMGGGRTDPNPSNEMDIYDPETDTWATGLPFATPRRNFPTDTDGSRVWLAGGYASDGVTPLQTTEIFQYYAPTAVSRKIHGGAGTFDIALPLTGSTGVECRTGGATNDYMMVVTFPDSVTVDGSPQAQVTSNTGCIGSGGVCDPSGSVSVSGAVVTIPLTNVANAQTITVQLNSVNGSDVVTIPMGILIGDTNGNGAVNAGDVAQTKSRIGQPVGASNFRSDVNANGAINAADTAIVKSHTGTSLPPQ